MQHQINTFIVAIISLTVAASVCAGDKVYTMEEIIKKDGYTYNKQNDNLISGIVKIYHKSGVLRGEVPINEGLPHGVARYYDTSANLLEERNYIDGKRHGVCKTYNNDGSLLSEKLFNKNIWISGFRYNDNGEKTEISSTMIQDYNASLPHPFAAKEAEAVKKINAAIKSSTSPTFDSNLTNEERFKVSIDVFTKAFEKAGYNYFDTINKVAGDLKNHRNNVPNKGESRHKFIIMLMGVQKSGCQYQKIDCLQLYPSEARESVQWLWENTGFSM